MKISKCSHQIRSGTEKQCGCPSICAITNAKRMFENAATITSTFTKGRAGRT